MFRISIDHYLFIKLLPIHRITKSLAKYGYNYSRNMWFNIIIAQRGDYE
jgi:hypothetical protein